jgi:phage terminase large subunit-like protein
LDVLDRTGQPPSKIQLIESGVCDGDEIMIDGSRGTMREIIPLRP